MAVFGHILCRNFCRHILVDIAPDYFKFKILLEEASRGRLDGNISHLGGFSELICEKFEKSAFLTEISNCLLRIEISGARYARQK